jgi:hypothetical protein
VCMCAHACARAIYVSCFIIITTLSICTAAVAAGSSTVASLLLSLFLLL